MNDVNSEVLRLAEAGASAAVATIVRTKGSTPREVGARMIVHANGETRGTVGGGCGEADVWAIAMEVLQTRDSRLIEVDLLNDSDEEGGRACGGFMYVFVEPLVGPASGMGHLSTGVDGNE